MNHIHIRPFTTILDFKNQDVKHFHTLEQMHLLVSVKQSTELNDSPYTANVTESLLFLPVMLLKAMQVYSPLSVFERGAVTYTEPFFTFKPLKYQLY